MRAFIRSGHLFQALNGQVQDSSSIWYAKYLRNYISIQIALTTKRTDVLSYWPLHGIRLSLQYLIKSKLSWRSSMPHWPTRMVCLSNPLLRSVEFGLVCSTDLFPVSYSFNLSNPFQGAIQLTVYNAISIRFCDKFPLDKSVHASWRFPVQNDTASTMKQIAYKTQCPAMHGIPVPVARCVHPPLGK